MRVRSDYDFLTVEQVAEICHVQPAAVRRWLRAGLIPSTRPPGRQRPILVRRSDLDKLLEPAS